MNTGDKTENKKKLVERLFGFLAEFIVKNRNKLFALMIAVACAGMYFSLRVAIDNSLELWFLEDDPALAAYNEFKKQYGSDEIILAMIDCRKDGMFSKDTLNAVYKAAKNIENDTECFRRVLSVGTAPYIGLKDDELIIEDMMEKEAATDLEAQEVKKRFLDDPFKRSLLQNASSTYAILIAEPVSGKDTDARRPFIIESVKKHLKGLDYRLAGMGIMYDELNRLSFRDGVVFNAVAYVVIALLVLALYRSRAFFLMAVGAMFFSSSWFLGAYGYFGENINMVTMVLPTLVMILSVSDVSYVYNNYCFNSAEIRRDREAGLRQVFNEVLSPCFFTSLTNTCGFVSLAASSLLVLRSFGIFAGLACLIEYFISMTVAAFVLGRIELKETIVIRRPFEGLINRWMSVMPRYYRHILLIFAALTALSIYGICSLNVDTYSMGFLPASNHVRIDSDNVEETYGCYLPLEIRIMTGKEGGILKTDFMGRLQKMHDGFKKAKGFEKPASIIDVFKKLNQVWSDGTEASYVVPDSDDKIAQLMMQYESDPDNDLEYITDKPAYSEARLTVRVPMVSAASLRRYEAKAEELLTSVFNGTDIKWKFGGYVPLYARIISYVTESQVTSFAVAFVFVFGAIALLFRQLGAMLLVILPNVFPILLTLGVMGLVGINLDIATVTIASIALGIIVDDTIHGLYLFYSRSRAHLTPEEAIVDADKESGPAMASTSVIFAVGFLFMVFASVKSVIYFGLLLSFTIASAFFCEITLLPAQICLLRGWLAKDFNKKINSEPIS